MGLCGRILLVGLYGRTLLAGQCGHTLLVGLCGRTPLVGLGGRATGLGCGLKKVTNSLRWISLSMLAAWATAGHSHHIMVVAG